MKKLLQTISLALLLCCGADAARADVKIKTRNTSAGQTSEGVTYIKGKRQRTEQHDTAVTITQCDLRRNIQLAVPTKTYVVMPFDQKPDAASSSSNAAKPSPATGASAPRRGGIVTSTFTSTDTGERKKIFGYTARRIKTSIATESSPDACQVNRSRMETDGWYIDAQFALDCDYGTGANAYVPPTPAGGCRDEYRTKQIGVAKLGYPVSVTTTLFDEKGQASFTFSQEVVEITNAVLDSALFEAPADYRQVNDMREMYSAAAMTAAAAGNSNDGDDANENATNGGNSGASRMNAGVGAKREGVVRVGVAMTETGLMGEGVNAAALAQAVRGALINGMGNSTVEVVALEASGTQEAESEAKRKECDFVLYSTVAHKKGGGGFGGFLKKSAAIASGTIAPTGNSGGGAANSLKAKDELTLEYSLQRGAEAVVANTLKAKAKSDGDDLISQLAGQAIVAVRAAVATKK